MLGIRFIKAAVLLVPVVATGAGAWTAEEYAEIDRLSGLIDKVRLLHKTADNSRSKHLMGRRGPAGESFRAYISTAARLPKGYNAPIHIQPIGDYTEEQNKMMKLTAEFCGLYFGLPALTLKNIPMSSIPADALSIDPESNEQVLTFEKMLNIIKSIIFFFINVTYLR